MRMIISQDTGKAPSGLLISISRIKHQATQKAEEAGDTGKGNPVPSGEKRVCLSPSLFELRDVSRELQVAGCKLQIAMSHVTHHSVKTHLEHGCHGKRLGHALTKG